MAAAILRVIESSDGRPIKFNLTYGSEFSLRITWKSLNSGYQSNAVNMFDVVKQNSFVNVCRE